MESSGFDRSFVTDGRIQLATQFADEIAARKPWFTASECAGEAVRKIFGRWILDHAASIRPGYLPLYFQLINTVENRLGLHRWADYIVSPMRPSMGAAIPAPSLNPSDVVATGAVAAS